MDARNLVMKINDVISDMRYRIDSSRSVWTRMDLPVISGPFSRSYAYSHKGDHDRVFMFRDETDTVQYYLIDCLDPYGQELYDGLWCDRLYVNRLNKELDKL